MTRLDEIDGRGQDQDSDFSDFFSLLQPIGRDTFYSRYWEKMPFLIRGRAEKSVRRVIDMIDIDTLIANSALRSTDLRAAKDHVTLPPRTLFPEGVADKQATLDAFMDGYSLIFDQIDRHVSALAAAMYAWETTLGQYVRANAFLTPRGFSGFHRHYDTHDVIVVQVYGNKTWDICDDPLPLPHEEQQSESRHWAKRANLIRQVDMAPGDLLYLPRGYVHAAEANDTDSLHISVSIRNLAMREVCLAALMAMIESFPEMRKGIVRGRIRTEDVRSVASDLPSRVDLRSALESLRIGFLGNRRSPENRLVRLQRTEMLTADSRLRIRDSIDKLLVRTGHSFVSIIDGRTKRFKAADSPAIDFAISSGEFRVEDIPAADSATRMSFAREMHCAGLVELCEVSQKHELA